jgi:hypothetical protein
MNAETHKRETPQPMITLRGVFEYAACYLGIAAAVVTGIAHPGSALQTSAAICMGMAFGTAYVLRTDPF